MIYFKGSNQYLEVLSYTQSEAGHWNITVTYYIKPNDYLFLPEI